MIKQIYKRYSDNTLIAKDDVYANITGVQFVQSTESTLWSLNHNESTTKIILQVFINNKLIENTFNIIDENNLEIPFSVPVSGFANIIFFK